MKSHTFAFIVTVYFVVTHIRCDIKSHSEKTKFIDKVLNNLSNKSNNAVLTNSVPFMSNLSVELDFTLEDALLTNEERGKICLKNITKCQEEDRTFQKSASKLMKSLFTFPAFDLSQVDNVSSLCRKHSQRYIEDLGNFKFWALKMYDSTAKLPSGILNGNVNQLGDFDMCLSASLESQNIYGKYCLASIEIQIPHSSYLSALHNLMQSHHHFKSRLEDPGHRVPRFSSINWAVCVPSSCSAKDVEKGIQKTIREIVEDTEIEVRLEVNPQMCKINEITEIPVSTMIAIFIFGLIIVVELLATAYDHYVNEEEKNKWITAFSLKKNFINMITIERSAYDITAVHGIRMVNAVLLLLAHKAMALFFLPYANRTEYVEFVSKPFAVIARAASLYTDPFIMISGTLTSYSLLGKLNRAKRINIWEEYVSRLIRIVPTFAALIAFCTFVLPWLDNGPMWSLVVGHHSDICKKYWWRNLLFIHNYFGFKDMCLTHTHHVGIDTQLFFVSPFLIYLLWKWPKRGTMVLISFATLSTIMRYYVTYSMRLSNYIHFGTSIQQLFETADNMYILPAHRATVYIVGIFLGYTLRNFKNINLSKMQLHTGNTIALLSFLVAFLGPAFMGCMDYIYNPKDAAWYAAISPILWVGSFAWIIFTSQLGYKGIVGTFFSHPAWTLWTKISYTVYLTQFPVYFYNVGTTRTAEGWGFFKTMFNLQEYTWVVGLAIVLTLVIEMPFQNLRNNIMNNRTIKMNLERIQNSSDNHKKVQ